MLLLLSKRQTASHSGGFTASTISLVECLHTLLQQPLSRCLNPYWEGPVLFVRRLLTCERTQQPLKTNLPQLVMWLRAVFSVALVWNWKHLIWSSSEVTESEVRVVWLKIRANSADKDATGLGLAQVSQHAQDKNVCRHRIGPDEPREWRLCVGRCRCVVHRRIPNMREIPTQTFMYV